MESISSNRSAVNGPTPPPTIKEVTDWVLSQASKADIGGASARLRVTALNQMVELVAEGEPRDARSVLARMPQLRERWARRNPGKESSTAQTYAARASATISEYFRWAQAPDKYEPKKKDPRRPTAVKPESSKAPKKADLGGTPPGEPAIMPPAAPPANQVIDDVRVCNLGQGRQPFRYLLPPDGLQVRDALRIAFHLITICDDYDPTVSPLQTVSSAIQRT